MLLILGTVALIASPSFAQKAANLGKDPRNQPFYEDGFCYGHHYPRISPDWENPSLVADAPDEVVVGVPFTVNLSLISNFNYNTLPSAAYLNLSASPNLKFVGEPFEETITAEGDVLLVDPLTRKFGRTVVPIAAPADVASLAVTVRHDGALAESPGGADLDVAVRSPDGVWLYANTSGPAAELVEVPEELAAFGAGREWLVAVTYRQGPEPSAHFVVEAVAKRDPETMRYWGLVSDVEMRERGENFTYSWTLVATEPGPALLDFKGRIQNFHKHTPADEGHTSDWGNLTRYDTAEVLVLSEPRPPEAPPTKSFLPATAAVGVLVVVGVAALAARRRS